MDFHLSFSIPLNAVQTNYSNKHLFVGSCFTESIGAKMVEHKFDACINPNGIVYNPLSIVTALNRLLDNKQLEEQELFYANEQWHHWQYHSKFSSADKAACLDAINESIAHSAAYLKNGNWLVITFGSAYVYEHIASNTLVSNCHKLPQKEFAKKLLTIEEMVEEYTRLLNKLKKQNPSINVLFTISPVRYIRDGVVENTLSKARLLETVHSLVAKIDNAFYFPSYELIIDDLRDYRFFKTDLVHPTEQAVDYVFEKLENFLFDTETLEIFAQIKKVLAAKNHRPLNPKLQAHKTFKKHYVALCEHLLKKHPYLNLDSEIEYFS